MMESALMFWVAQGVLKELGEGKFKLLEIAEQTTRGAGRLPPPPGKFDDV